MVLAVSAFCESRQKLTMCGSGSTGSSGIRGAFGFFGSCSCFSTVSAGEYRPFECGPVKQQKRDRRKPPLELVL